MQLHQLQPVHKSKEPKRIGRGGKRGTYSGRGVKGQLARAGAKKQPAIRQWIKRYPKLRGYRFGRISQKPTIISLGLLDKNFKDGEVVTPRILIQKGLIEKKYGKIPEVKILSGGQITKKIIVRNCQTSEKAAQKIKEAGGKIFTA